jgi:predicted transcriptional regulator
MQEKKDFILQLICGGKNSIQELKKETNYSYPDLMQCLKELVLNKKISRNGKLEFYPMEKILLEQKEMNELMTQTCCIKCK